MTKPETTHSTNNSNARLVADVIALRADLVGLIIQAERVLESSGVPVESVIVTRRERRVNLTRRRR